MKLILSLSILTFLAISTTAPAHPGGLDKNGGHVDSKTGKYHKHQKAPEKAPAKAPAKSPAKK